MGVSRAVIIADAIRQRITGGEFEPGDMLPPTRELLFEYRTTGNTIATALAYLVGEGLIYRVPFKGTWVKERQ